MQTLTRDSYSVIHNDYDEIRSADMERNKLRQKVDIKVTQEKDKERTISQIRLLFLSREPLKMRQ